ncbi:MAG: Xaa-Pro aminopeptidase [Verrucomicrobiota bacterium]|jgi:Xaa-Pro aminopeptidase
MKTSENFLLVADSERDANMLYAARLFVPDPFIWARVRGRDHIVMSDLEIDRARIQAPHCRVHSLSKLHKKLRDSGMKRPSLADVTVLLLRELRVKKVFVPDNFPLGLANDLAKQKISVTAKRDGFFPTRELKTPDEIRHLTAALRLTEAGLAAGIAALRASKIGKARQLVYRGAALTSERLRAVIDCAVIEAGGLPANTIVAGGEQGCDPHERGHGPLRAHEPIILDIFPRAAATGYYGDLTRTVVRGRASEAVRNIYDTVFAGQQTAFKLMRPGVPTADVHAAVQKLFEARGYQTGQRNGRMEGFFHGTGHGLGLEIHESPRMGATSPGKLQTGQVITVEPGLYYPGIGGVRLEDVAVITAGNPRNLTVAPKNLEV